MSIGSDVGERTGQNVRRKKHSVDSVNSESLNSRTDSLGVTPDDDSMTNHSSIDDISKNQVASAALSGSEDGIQNNERCISNLNKEKKIGQNVNELYVDKVSKINSELDNLTKLALADEEIAGKRLSDVKGDEKNVTRIRTLSKQSTSSNKSVSIEMDGDNLCVTTEELDDDVLVGGDNILNGKSDNVVKDTKETMCSETVTNRVENISVSPELNGLGANGTVTGHESGQGRTICVPQHPQSLNLSAINTTVPPTNKLTDLTATPDISISHHRNSSSSSTTTSGPDSEPPSPYSTSPSSEPWEPVIHLDTPSSPESLSHNLQFPENSVSGGSKTREKKTAKEQVCGVFSVDLGMRSIFRNVDR